MHKGRNERHLSGSVMESTLLICHLVGTLQAAAKQPLIRLPWKEDWFGACEAEIWFAAILGLVHFSVRYSLCKFEHMQRTDNACYHSLSPLHSITNLSFSVVLKCSWQEEMVRYVLQLKISEKKSKLIHCQSISVRLYLPLRYLYFSVCRPSYH